MALGLTGAVVLASVAGSRRGREALDEFLEFHRYGNVEAFVDPSLPVDDQVALMEAMIDASGQEDYALRSMVILALPGPDGLDGEGTDLLVGEAYIVGEPMAEVKRALVTDGALPLDPGEVAVTQSLVRRRGVGVGDTLTLALFPPRPPTASATASSSSRGNWSR